MDLTSSGNAQTHHGFVGDIQQLQSLKNGGSDTQEGLKKVAQEFESLYLKMMLDSMRKAEKVWAKDNPFSSSEQDMFKDMLDGQLSKELSSQGSLGLADMLVRQLAPHINERKEKSGAQEIDAIKPGLKMPKREVFNLQMGDDLVSLQQLSPKSLVSQELVSQKPAPQQVAPQQVAFKTAGQLAQWQTQMNSAEYKIPEIHNVDDFAGDPDRFTEVMMPYAVKAGHELGVDPKLLVAQAALETGWGGSLKASQHGFNMFGIKAGQSWSGEAKDHLTSEVYNGQTLKQTASFRAYNSIEQSFNDYVSLIQSRYSSAQAQASSPEDYVQQLSAGGYATDPLYADKVMAVYRSDRVQKAPLQQMAMQEKTAQSVTLAQVDKASLERLSSQYSASDLDPRLQIW